MALFLHLKAFVNEIALNGLFSSVLHSFEFIRPKQPLAQNWSFEGQMWELLQWQSSQSDTGCYLYAVLSLLPPFRFPAQLLSRKALKCYGFPERCLLTRNLCIHFSTDVLCFPITLIWFLNPNEKFYGQCIQRPIIIRNLFKTFQKKF